MSWYSDFALPRLDELPRGVATVGMHVLRLFVWLTMCIHLLLIAACMVLTVYTLTHDGSMCLMCVPLLMLIVYLLTMYLCRRMLRELLNEITVTMLTTGEDHMYIYTTAVDKSKQLLGLNNAVVMPFVCAGVGVLHLYTTNGGYGVFAIAVGCIGYAVITTLHVSSIFLSAMSSACNVHLVDLEEQLKRLKVTRSRLSQQQQGGTGGNVQGNC